jgi:hypothetical protein
MLTGVGICWRCGHLPSGHHKGLGSSFSRLQLRGRILACQLDFPSISALMRALFFGGSEDSTTTCKSLLPKLYGLHNICTYLILSQWYDRESILWMKLLPVFLFSSMRTPLQESQYHRRIARRPPHWYTSIAAVTTVVGSIVSVSPVSTELPKCSGIGSTVPACGVGVYTAFPRLLFTGPVHVLADARISAITAPTSLPLSLNCISYHLLHVSDHHYNWYIL